MDICLAVRLRIRELRQKKGITEYELIKRTCLASSTFKSVMNGKSKNPGITTIYKIAYGLDISLQEFFASDIFLDLEFRD